MPETLTITRPDDWHLHLRDGAAMASVVRASARQFARAIVMPNLRPPVVTVAQARSYRRRILDALARGAGFEPLMTLYLTDATQPGEIEKAAASGFVRAVKYYPAGATTHSAARLPLWVVGAAGSALIGETGGGAGPRSAAMPMFIAAKSGARAAPPLRLRCRA